MIQSHKIKSISLSQKVKTNATFEICPNHIGVLFMIIHIH